MIRFALNYFCIYTTFAVMAPYLQLFLRAGGLDPSRIGILLGIYEIAGIFGPIFLGRAADTHGRFRFQLGATVLLFFAVFLVVYLIPHPAVMTGGLILMGFLYKSLIPLTDSFTTHTLPNPERDYGKVRIMGSVGFFSISLFFQITGAISGDSRGSILAWLAGFTVLYLASLLALPQNLQARSHPAAPGDDRASRPAGRAAQDIDASAVPGTGIPPMPAVREGIDTPAGEGDEENREGSLETAQAAATPAPKRKITEVFPPVFWLGLLLISLGRAALAAHYSFFSVYLQERFGLTTVSGMWAIGPIVEIPFIFFSGYLIRRFGLISMFVASFIGISMRLTIYALSPGLGGLVAAQLLHSLTFGVFHTTSIAFARRTVREEGRFMAVSLYAAIGGGAATFAGSAIAGFIVESAGYQTLFLTYACLPMVALGGLPFLNKRINRQPAT